MSGNGMGIGGHRPSERIDLSVDSDVRRWLERRVPKGPLAELRDLGRTVAYRSPSGVIREMCEAAAYLDASPADESAAAEELRAAGKKSFPIVVRVVASTEDEDRYRDIIIAKGWQLDNYAKNPVILLDHSYQVGAMVGLASAKVQKKQLVLTITHDESPENVAASMVMQRLSTGLLRSVSVGFMPVRWEWITYPDPETGDPRYTGGVRYLETDLMEVSWVAVPANPNALIETSNDKGAAPGGLAVAPDIAVDTPGASLVELAARFEAAAAGR